MRLPLERPSVWSGSPLLPPRAPLSLSIWGVSCRWVTTSGAWFYRAVCTEGKNLLLRSAKSHLPSWTSLTTISELPAPLTANRSLKTSLKREKTGLPGGQWTTPCLFFKILAVFMSVLFLKGMKSQKVVNFEMIFTVDVEKGALQEAGRLTLKKEPFFSPPPTSVWTLGISSFFLSCEQSLSSSWPTAWGKPQAFLCRYMWLSWCLCHVCIRLPYYPCKCSKRARFSGGRSVPGSEPGTPTGRRTASWGLCHSPPACRTLSSAGLSSYQDYSPFRGWRVLTNVCGTIRVSTSKAIYFRRKHWQQNLNNLSGMCQIECFRICFWLSLVERLESKSFVILDFSTVCH